MDGLAGNLDIGASQYRASQSALESKSSNLLKSGAVKGMDMEAIEAVAQDFEAVFISEMIKPMFEELKTDGPFSGGKGEEVFRGMMLQEYGKIMAETGDIGIADEVKKTLISIQEAAYGPMDTAVTETDTALDGAMMGETITGGYNGTRELR